LDGSGSYDTDNDLVSYEWTQVSGTAVDLSDFTAIQPTFTAPDVGVEGASLIFSLKVKDSTGKTYSDTCTVYVEWKNSAPTADAGDNQSIKEGDLALLDGSGSFDPDNDSLSYEWTQVSGQTVILSDFTAIQPTFAAPDVGIEGASLTFKLKVTDSGELQSADTCVITVEWVNTPPIANAGADQTVEENITVTLNGSGSSDTDDGIAAYQWRQISGTSVSLLNPTAISTTFISPDVNEEGETLLFELTVEDNGKLTAADTCEVYVSEKEIKDKDKDGIPDDQDIFPDDPNEWLDADKDSIGNNADPDDDNDDMPDIWEAEYGLNLFEDDAADDLDNDGISNIDEYVAGSDPTKAAYYQPMLSFPADGAADVSFTPELNIQPFTDSDKIHSKTEWQISTVSDFSLLTLDLISNAHLTALILPDFVLERGTLYYWRVRFYFNDNVDSSLGLEPTVSEWSAPYSFSTQMTFADDKNSNGIPDDQEVTDTVMDMDADGTPDISQDDILCVNAVIGERQIAVKASENVTAVKGLKSVNPNQIADENNKPESMPSGLITFKLTLSKPGDTARVHVYFSELIPADAKWYKYDSVNGWWNYSDHAVFSSDRKSVTLELKDGGFGDADGAENGVIIDPSGFTTVSSESQAEENNGGDNCFISTASDGSLIKKYVAALLILLFSFLKIRE